jgi:hypothetical protein
MISDMIKLMGIRYNTRRYDGDHIGEKEKDGGKWGI